MHNMSDIVCTTDKTCQKTAKNFTEVGDDVQYTTIQKFTFFKEIISFIL